MMIANVYFAKYYAIQMLDKELFESLLAEVENYNIDDNPDYRLMNSIAKQKAKALREKSQIYWLED